MTTRLEILRALCLGSIALSLVALGGVTIPRAVPPFMEWGASVGFVLWLIALLVLFAACALFGAVYWFVASIAVAAFARPFTGPENVSKLLLGAGWPAFDRALIHTLRRLRLAR